MKFDFFEWLADNHHIWEAFEREALRTAQKRKHYSAKTIVEFLRHHTLITETSGEWKINNYATSHLARLFMQSHPEHKGFFETRGLK